jgi:hypothetical protein
MRQPSCPVGRDGASSSSAGASSAGTR